MSDPRPERPVDLGKRRVVLRYDINALCELELVLGVSGVQALAARLDDIGFGTLRAFVWAGVLHGDEQPTLRQVGSWIDAGRLEPIGVAIGEAFAAAFPDIDDNGGGGDEADPTTPAGAGSSGG